MEPYLFKGTTTLNQQVRSFNWNGAYFYIHYWGALPRYYDNVLHRHSFFEAAYVVEGEGSYLKGNGEKISLSKGSLFLSQPEILHKIESDNGLSLLYIGFELITEKLDANWLEIIAEVKKCLDVVICTEESGPSISLWKALLQEASTPGGVFFQETLHGLTGCVLQSLFHTLIAGVHEQRDYSNPEMKPSLFNEVQLYINDNITGSLKLEELANHFHISERQLSRMFLSEAGISFSKFVQREKIEKASGLLIETSLSIKEIAEAVGFSTVHYFTSVFSTKKGLPPGKYRDSYKKD